MSFVIIVCARKYAVSCSPCSFDREHFGVQTWR
jgi:hypothetical protein